MSWKVYKLIYQAETPIYIGYYKLGFIQCTRYYILGRNFWGAVTANLARTTGGNYEKIGQEVNNKIRFTYLYPALEKDRPLLPRYTEDGLEYGSYSAPEFERIFIHAYTQTALEPTTLTAEEGSLHETECIAPLVEVNNEFKPVSFIGYIFLKEGTKIETIPLDLDSNSQLKEKVLSRIYVGGERKYGFGQLRLKDGTPEHTDDKLFNLFNYKIDEDKVSITIPRNKPIPAHLIISDSLTLKGNIEPLVGREYEEDAQNKHPGFGQKISNAKLCWLPGSVVTREKQFKIDDYGILEVQNGRK